MAGASSSRPAEQTNPIPCLPMIVWAETDYSVYTMRQASRRSWRNRPDPVRPGRRHSLPEHPAGGRPPARGAEAPFVAGGGGRVTRGRPRRLRGRRRRPHARPGEEDHRGRGGPGSVESVFEQARQVAAGAEALLVDEDWHAPEPEPVVVGAGVAADPPVDDDAPEPQRTLFSWAEFMAGEPEEPPRKRRDEAPTLSLFEWALEQGKGTRRSRRVGLHAGRTPPMWRCPPCPPAYTVPSWCSRAAPPR